jgi:RNA polymerase sigma factor (sigma-70 family)
MAWHGDEEELFQSFNAELHRDVGRAVRASDADVEDACAYAWAQFLRYQPDRDRNWRGWLYRVATREAIRLSRIDTHTLPIFRTNEFFESEAKGVVEPIDPRQDLADKRIDLHDALVMLSRVPGRRKEAAVLKLIGLSYGEIADALDITPTAVNRLLVEARLHIYEQLAQHRAPSTRDRPRVARLAELEQNPPLWLSAKIGPVPSARHPAAKLAWRRAALALDDYRRDYGMRSLVEWARPTDRDEAARFDRAERAIAEVHAKRDRFLDRFRDR